MNLDVTIPEWLYDEPDRADYPDTPEGDLHYKMMRNAYMRSVLSGNQNHRCCWCGVRLSKRFKSTRPTIEHVIPKSIGGTDDLDNCAIACHGCNSARGVLSIEDFMDVVAEAKSGKTSPKAILKYRMRKARAEENQNVK